MASRGARRSAALAPAAVIALLLLVGALWVMVFTDFRTADEMQTEAVAEPAGTSAATANDASTPAGDDSEGDPTDGAGPGEWSLADARTAFATDGSRTLVLGDGTGDGWDEWAFLWAEEQGLPGAMWMTQTENGYSGVTEETRLWSGGMPEATAEYPLEHWDAMWPEATPDLVLLSFGHFAASPDDATAALTDLRDAIAEEAPEAPIVVILQNPAADDADADVREAIAAWADDAGLPTIDVAAAFANSGQVPANLRLDEIHPSTAGSELWAETVGEALAG